MATIEELEERIENILQASIALIEANYCAIEVCRDLKRRVEDLEREVTSLRALNTPIA